MPPQKGIIGLKRAVLNLKTVRDSITEEELKRIVEAAAKPMLEAARSGAPVGETGQLKAQLHIEVRSTKTEANANIGNTKETWYGIFVEFGAYGKAGIGFMRRAFDSQKETAKAYVRAQLQNKIETVGKKLEEKSPYDTTDLRGY